MLISNMENEYKINLKDKFFLDLLKAAIMVERKAHETSTPWTTLLNNLYLNVDTLDAFNSRIRKDYDAPPEEAELNDIEIKKISNPAPKKDPNRGKGIDMGF